MDCLLPSQMAHFCTNPCRIPVIDTIPFSQIQDVAETLKRPLEGGTDLANGIETAITALSKKEGRRTLLLFTDGEDGLDILDLNHKLCMAKVHLKVYEARDTDISTPLQELTEKCGGKYQRI